MGADCAWVLGCGQGEANPSQEQIQAESISKPKPQDLDPEKAEQMSIAPNCTVLTQQPRRSSFRFLCHDTCGATSLNAWPKVIQEQRRCEGRGIWLRAQPPLNHSPAAPGWGGAFTHTGRQGRENKFIQAHIASWDKSVVLKQTELRTEAQNSELVTTNCTRASGGSCKAFLSPAACKAEMTYGVTVKIS